MAPGFDHMGTGLVEESSVAVWVGDVSLTLSAPTHSVGPTPVGALSHGPGLEGNDPLPRHIPRVVLYLGMADLVCRSVTITLI